MPKRTTRTNAETLENVRRQAEERGRALGRQDLAVELMKAHRWADTDALLRANNCRCFTEGVVYDPRSNGRGKHWRMHEVVEALAVLEDLLMKITEEANTPAF